MGCCNYSNYSCNYSIVITGGNFRPTIATDAINTICAWLIDPIACPTEWNVLLTIRNDNPLYGGDTPPTVA